MHGVFSCDLVLPHESQAMFRAFRQAMLASLLPRDFLEWMLAEQIIAAAWKLRRLSSIETVFMLSAIADGENPQRDPDEIDYDAKDRFGQPIWKWTGPEPRPNTKLEPAPPIVGQALAFDDGNERVQRVAIYTQRLELSIHRNLKQLSNLRKRTQSEDGLTDVQVSFLASIGLSPDEVSDDFDEEDEPKDDVEIDDETDAVGEAPSPAPTP